MNLNKIITLGNIKYIITQMFDNRKMVEEIIVFPQNIVQPIKTMFMKGF